MLWRDSIVATSITGAVVAGAVLLGAGTAGAGTLYRWKTENGTLAFADDPKRIPERYRERAEAIETEGLDGYGRYTPTDAAAQQEYADRLAERLDGLRERSGVGEAPAGAVVIEEPPARHPLEGVALQSTREEVGRRLVNTEDGPRWRRTTRLQTVDQPTPVLGVTPDPDSEEPVVVERVRARSRDALVTRHITVVRQGDRVLSVIKPRARQSTSDWPIEEDFER
jgi:hypothetical protein